MNFLSDLRVSAVEHLRKKYRSVVLGPVVDTSPGSRLRWRSVCRGLMESILKTPNWGRVRKQRRAARCWAVGQSSQRPQPTTRSALWRRWTSKLSKVLYGLDRALDAGNLPEKSTIGALSIQSRRGLTVTALCAILKGEQDGTSP